MHQLDVTLSRLRPTEGCRRGKCRPPPDAALTNLFNEKLIFTPSLSSIFLFIFLVDKAGCPSGLLTAGGSAPEEQQSKSDVELPAPGTGSVRSSSLGRMTHGHGHSDAGDDGCRNRHLFHSRDRQLGLNARTPLLLMDGGLMLWKRMELSHLGRMKRYPPPPFPPERWKTSTRV